MIIWPTPRPAVKAAITILSDAYPDDVTVSHRMPRTRPAKFVRVIRVPGGGLDNPRFDRARLIVEVWAKDIGTVETLFNQGRAALKNAGGTTVSDDIFIQGWEGDEGGGDYSDPDVPDMEKWQFFGELLVSTR